MSNLPMHTFRTCFKMCRLLVNEQTFQVSLHTCRTNCGYIITLISYDAVNANEHHTGYVRKSNPVSMRLPLFFYTKTSVLVQLYPTSA